MDEDNSDSDVDDYPSQSDEDDGKQRIIILASSDAKPLN